MQEARDKYVADTGDVLRQKGCRAAYVENNEEATLEIRIERLATHQRPAARVADWRIGWVDS